VFGAGDIEDLFPDVVKGMQKPSDIWKSEINKKWMCVHLLPVRV
jgi:hypothetical protein